ncbi:MexE family multidrug efflux RND transporter periplasmic adaptor subunit [Desulfoluna limicola]|uniref:MexE family multidrug efflux RND transporter periplasmic adaptor subunit n=1 Tax=Desulfoluna limicola TaxID=2810562 RepID=A0ABN6FA78_9BACT|nr:efflux RND transporter periplasmic adaptor subunit [Desulfoluna limicola]BCS99116.1 MexE family multidrug efflux RND transporter periplasmic adaptor subunit [Desulfoluna limicola]
MNDDGQLIEKEVTDDKGTARLKWLLPVVIIAVGVVAMGGMILAKKTPERTVAVERGQFVETVPVVRAEGRAHIVTHGTVTPFQQMDLVPRVSGYVATDNLEAGQLFEKGAVLFTIDAEDYRLAAVKAEAQVVQAELSLEEIRSKAVSARLEWERMPGREGMTPSPLLLYEPQLAAAEAQLKGARADLAARRLDIRRCTVTAPFACRVLAETVAPGQFVSQGMKVASLLGSGRMDVVVPVTAEELAWVAMDRAEVTVRTRAGGETLAWKGTLVRRLADVDADGRMAKLLIRVDDPYGHEANALVPNMYVEVDILGREIENALAIPFEALVDGRQVYVLSAEKTLAVRDVRVVRRQKEQVLVSGDLADGELAITSGVAGAAPGMKLRQWEASRP